MKNSFLIIFTTSLAAICVGWAQYSMESNDQTVVKETYEEKI